ncbi:hypothetical protein BU26DRAFT_526143 [Trematosphaeria pertusa]|uniref:Uncharacterized protein n=1 Tax=Trematosphaeria pertusa TaxID=390896 RepID=A0A6A6HS24_9PLEO|nr:uncharacterized protein BU26DRAFT_526143 [Trematosphaeria pertusa]KAF2240250.1 hypothetical protein BU26DRAFT_526143 [Trematosphaeria pertusa]
MSSSFNISSQRRVLPQIIEALQRLADDPEQLGRERAQRYSESPPPYPSSGEVTQPDTPEERPRVDEEQRWNRFWDDRDQSMPCFQFERQVKREMERLQYQSEQGRFGRKQTLPLDETQDYLVNAENNVRARWVEQGIWKEWWGPAWPKGLGTSGPRIFAWRHKGGPSVPGGIGNLARWGHEKRLEPPLALSQPEPEPEPEPAINTFVFKFPTIESEREDPRSSGEKSAAVSAEQRQAVQPEPEPEPESESELESIPEPDPLTKSTFPGLFDSVPRIRKKHKIPTAESIVISWRHISDMLPAGYQLNPSASRPYYQFLFQASKESEWIRDEYQYERHTGFVDIDAKAYESVKNMWIEDKIWNPKWDQLPGMTWMHEEDPDDRPQTPDIFKEGREERRQRREERRQRDGTPPGPDEIDEMIRKKGRQMWGLSPSPVSNGKQQLHSSRPGPPQLKPVLDVDNNRGGGNDIPSFPRDVNDSSGAVARPNDRGRRRESAGRLPTVPETPRLAEEPADGVLRSVRQSKVEKPSKANASAPNRRLRKHSHRANEPGQTSNSPENGTLLPPRNGTNNPVPENEQAAPGRRTQTSKLSSLTLAQSKATEPESKPQGQLQTNGRSKRVALAQLLSEAPNGLGRQHHSQAGLHSSIEVSVPRRSARIAELQKAGRGSEQGSKAGITLKRKRSPSASSTDRDGERSRPKQRNTPTSADRHQIRKIPSSADTRARARLRQRPS